MTGMDTGTAAYTVAWDTSGWEVTFTPAVRCGIRHWRWTLANRRSRHTARITRLALTEQAAFRRAFRAFQKAAAK